MKGVGEGLIKVVALVLWIVLTLIIAGLVIVWAATSAR